MASIMAGALWPCRKTKKKARAREDREHAGAWEPTEAGDVNMGKVPNNKAKKNNGKKGTLHCRTKKRERFLNRHIDQVRRRRSQWRSVPGGRALVLRTHAGFAAALSPAAPTCTHSLSAFVPIAWCGQVWKDVRADPEKKLGPTCGPEELGGIRADAALPRTTKQVVDEDLPGMGQFYCVETGRWFIDAKALAAHKKSRFFKMRVKELKGAAPHSQRDAEMAVGLGVDNGPKLGRDPRPKAMETE